MIVYEQMPLAADDVATAHEINAAQQSFASEMNGGIDRENIPAHAILDTKLANGCTEFYEASDTATGTLTNTGGAWTAVLPGAAGVDFQVTGPGRLLLHGVLTLYNVLETAAPSDAAFAVGVRVDGRVVGDTGMDNYTSSGAFDGGFSTHTKVITAAPWVGPGIHDVELVCRLLPDPLSYDHLESRLVGIMRRR